MVGKAKGPVDAPVEEADGARGGGAQTLLRGLDVMEAVAGGASALSDLAETLGLTRSTTHRLAAALVERRYLALAPREGYSLGPKLLELGYFAQQQRELCVVARPHLEALVELTEDTVHLGMLDEDRALYLDKLAGRRRIQISSRIGDRQPVTSTGLGKALILDDTEARWRDLYAIEGDGAGPGQVDVETWVERMHDYAREGRAFDLEENEDRLRCVAAPIRGVSGRIVGAISVSGAAQYMSDDRLAALSRDVKTAAEAIGTELGGAPDAAERAETVRTRRRPKATA